jgi:hypothetical protein
VVAPAGTVALMNVSKTTVKFADVPFSHNAMDGQVNCQPFYITALA